MPNVEIIIGSTSDQQLVKSSGMLAIFAEIGVSCRLSVISAHRNHKALTQHCEETLEDTYVYIGVAGMAAALPGALTSTTNRRRPIIGVALSSPEHPEYFSAARDSIIFMPPGSPVNYTGSDKPGLRNAALSACEIIALSDNCVARKLATWFEKHTKPAQINIQVSGDSQQPQEQ